MRSQTAKKPVISALKKWIFEIIMLVLSFGAVGPILYTLISSFKTEAEVNRPLTLPARLYLGNYILAFKEANIHILFINSFTVAVFSIGFLVFIGSLAAFAIGRRSEKVFKNMYIFFLSGLMIPFQAGMLPLFTFIRRIGLYNKIPALIIIQVGTLLPLSILIFTGFIKTIPRAMDESAEMDGCGVLKTYFHIILPLLRPATVAVIITTSVFVWNDFMNPLLFIQSAAKKTLPLGIYSFMGIRTVLYGPIFAIVMISIIPPVAAFLGLQKYFYKGITAGSVKG